MSSIVGHSATATRPSSRLSSRFDSKFDAGPSSRPSSRASVRPSSAIGVAPPARDAEYDNSEAQAGSGPNSPGSGKRKRNLPIMADDGLLRGTIILKPYPSTLMVKPRILHPLMLLPRETLPLSALDLSQPYGDFPICRLFESKIKILDLEGRLGSNVLLARSETNRVVYALEWESNGLYVLCKVGSWVNIEALSQSATVVCRERLKGGKTVKNDSRAESPLITPSMYNENKRRRLTIEGIQSLVRKRSVSVVEKELPSLPASAEAVEESQIPRPEESQPAALPLEHAGTHTNSGPSPSSKLDTPIPAAGPANDSLTQPDADGIFQNVRAQYMEALYHSKGSLAYFAKGPLSRARAAFHMDWDSNLDMNDLIEFMKSLVMTTVVIDKKYRETIPGIIATTKPLGQDSDGASKTKKRKTKKPKLGKDGLYPGEVDHIRSWWISNQPTSSEDEQKSLTAIEHKYHVSYLRRRETQLQIILVLEILALEPLAQAKGTECQLPGMETQAPSREASQEPSAKKRNKHNLPVLLDVHADRLCIWQSTTLDEVKAVAESQPLTAGPEGELERANSNPLRDFCVDVIVPFFSARLPGPCDSLSRKLGGPVAQSPPKSSAAKPASTVKPKPGAPIRRPTTKRDKDRSLERALSVERNRRSVSRGPSAAIALLRSASQTVIPGMKREASDSSIMGLVPRADSGSVKERPSNIFSRSVSLSSIDLKAQKKAQVDAELKDAISALKKPNRSLAVKDIVDAADKRASAGQLKKLKKPNRAGAVQVKATPANNRYKDALAAEKKHAEPSPFSNMPPSSASMIPASTLPRKFSNRLSTAGAPTDRVHATPARPAASSIPATDLRPIQETPGPGLLPSSPIMARKGASAPAPPLFAAAQLRSDRLAAPKGRFASGDIPSSPGLGALFETPLAPRSGKDRLSMVDDSPIRPRLPLGAMGDGGNRAVRVKTKGTTEKVVAASVTQPIGGSDGAESATGATENKSDTTTMTTKTSVNIYQQLGWETTDLDDIDDLL
ncbi:DNA replication regulator SLD3-domain-containing protein [Chaetomium sp. MPI-SDFR-AT-0129]|nr:DNA replication regulator SLD3-domain-containing protein [Chaetomium sp. MPI-SDFR-AT-0129]